MNGKKAKMARRIAREEVEDDPTPMADRELIAQRWRGHDRVINNPFTVHGFSKQVKRAYLKQQRGQSA